MSYVYQTLTIKPADSKWYPDIEPIKHANYMKWYESHPLITKINNKRLTENEHLRVTQFATEEDYNAFVAERDIREDYIERQHFLNTNGFITEVQIIQTT
jgi:hypothetical protein